MPQRSTSKAIKAEAPMERHTISLLVDNEFGVLARVIGQFSGRGYNIESLTVAQVSEVPKLSRMTIVTTGTPAVIVQIMALLDRVVPVHKVLDMTSSGKHVERELALIKVIGSGDERVEALRLADVFRAHIVDATNDSFIFEITGSAEKIDTFIGLMQPLGLAEVCRTGVVAISRGKILL